MVFDRSSPTVAAKRCVVYCVANAYIYSIKNDNEDSELPSSNYLLKCVNMRGHYRWKAGKDSM